MLSFDVSFGSAPARVRTAHIHKDVGFACTTTHAWCVVVPLAPPRLWHMVSGATSSGFQRGLAEGPVGEPSLQRALGVALQNIHKMQGMLVEPALPIDAQFGAIVVSGETLLVTVSSGVRVYRARKGEPKRLLAQGHRSPGLSRGGMSITTERPQRGDLYVLGSRDAFALRSIGALAALLAEHPSATSGDVTEAVLGPCRSAGIGVGIVALRVI
jgi:hypothetical protein